MRGVGLIVILAPAFFGSLPTWSYSGSWGYVPSALLAAALVATVAAVILGSKGRT